MDKTATMKTFAWADESSVIALPAQNTHTLKIQCLIQITFFVSYEIAIVV